jgi:hypothetical protein
MRQRSFAHHTKVRFVMRAGRFDSRHLIGSAASACHSAISQAGGRLSAP